MNYNINILTLFFFYFFVIFSITGIGLFFSSIVLKEKIILNIGYKGIFGLFIVSIYSYISSNFFPHSLLHNLIFNLFGLFFFFLLFFN